MSRDSAPTPDLAAVWARVERLWSAALSIGAAEHELDRVLQQIADSARDVVGCKYAALGVLDETGDELKQFVASGISAEVHAKIGDLPTGKGILGVLIREPRPLRLNRIEDHDRFVGFPPHHPPMTTFLGVPIVGRRGPIGNLYLTEKIGAPEFTDQDEALASMLAAYAAVAVENARLNAERERLVRELRSMQASRERFFAMINHELRNALTAVHGWSELWLRKLGQDPPRAAVEVYESSEQAITLLEDVLDLSRLDAERLEPKLREADLVTVIREAVAAGEPEAERRGVRLEIEGSDAPITIRTDPRRVRQILLNLLSNATRHSPANEAVTLALTNHADRVQIDVVDRGEGIAADRQQAIFEAFERSPNDEGRGTGLGLALSRRLARLLGGDLRVESRLGDGARFILELPRYAPTLKIPS